MKKKIAVFTTGWGAEILGQFLDGMKEELRRDNADVFLFLCYAAFADSPAKKQGEMNIYNLPDLRDFDGAMIFGSGLDYKDRIDDIIARSNEAGIPVIIQGSRREGISFVGSDNYQAVKDLCAHVVKDHGVKNITFFAGTKDSHDSELRLQAVRDYLKENGVVVAPSKAVNAGGVAVSGLETLKRCFSQQFHNFPLVKILQPSIILIIGFQSFEIICCANARFHTVCNPTIG